MGRFQEKGYNCPLWLTYKQAAELGGQVRKGEKGLLVVYANTITKTATDKRDFSFEAQAPISAYIKASQAEGRIVEQLPVRG